MEITAPAASIEPGQVDPVTFSRIAAKPASWPSNWEYGCAATATSDTKMYSVVTMDSAIMIASGILRCGFLTSSPAVETASIPIKEKKMMPAAAVIPLNPNGVKSARLLEFHPVMPITMNSTSTAILISTMMVFTIADSLAPRMSSRVQSAIKITAGRLRIPPCSGAWDNASGIWMPNRLPSSWLRYCDQPTDTAAADTPYSSSRHAATAIAGNSPTVAYAYEYEEPETGTAPASSA